MSNINLIDTLRNLDGDGFITFLHRHCEEVSTITYRDLGRLVESNACHFQECGIQPGVMVGICLHTTLEHCVAFLALISAGAIPVSVKPPISNSVSYSTYLSKVFKECKVDYVYYDLPVSDIPKIRWVSQSVQRSQIRDKSHTDITPDSIAFIQFSSGSTSEPKPIEITHTNLLSNILTIHRMDGRNHASIGFNFLPLNHDMGLIGGFLSNIVSQNPLYLCPTDDFVRNPIAYMTLFENAKVDVTAMPNFMLRVLSAWLRPGKSKTHQYFSHIKTIYCGAEAIHANDVNKFIERASAYGLNPNSLLFCYGLAEATLYVTGHRFSNSSNDFHVSSSGRVVTNVGTPASDTKITVENRDPVTGVGEICIDGPGVSPKLISSLDNKLHTGDLGFIKNENLFVTGRMKDIFIVNGRNIYAQDIEDILRDIDGIKDCLALQDSDQIKVALIVKNWFEPDMITLNSLLSQELGCSASTYVCCKPSDIQRTSSGKVSRPRTLNHLKQQGYI